MGPQTNHVTHRLPRNRRQPRHRCASLPSHLALIANASPPGLALVTLLAARPNTIVFAGARDPARATALQALAKAHPDRFHILKLVVPDKEDHLAAAEEIKRIAGRLDVVIANAAFADVFDPALDLRGEDMVRHFEVRGELW